LPPGILDLISHSDFHSLTSQIEEVRKMLTGLLDRLRQSIEDTRRRQKPRYRGEGGERSASGMRSAVSDERDARSVAVTKK
jgi:hypothetical protein